MYSLFDYSQMVAYRARVAGFTEALKQSQIEGAVVCDLGTGFGFFAILAAKLGARRVYGIEHNDAIDMAAKLASDNGVTDRIRWIKGMSTDAVLPEKVDILVSDLRATTPFLGAHISSLTDARSRFLAPGGRLIPMRDTLRCALVGSSQLYNRVVQPWKGAVQGISLDAIHDQLTERPKRCYASPGDLLPGIQTWGVLDYRELEESDHSAKVSWQIENSATCYGLCLWFDCELCPGVEISGAPGAPPLPYAHLFLPWRQPMELAAGQKITVDLTARLQDSDYVWDWDANVSGEGAAMREMGELVSLS